MFPLTSKSRQKKCTVFKKSRRAFKAEGRHKSPRVLCMLTVRLEECLAGHGQPITEAGDRFTELSQISGSHAVLTLLHLYGNK